MKQVFNPNDSLLHVICDIQRLKRIKDRTPEQEAELKRLEQREKEINAKAGNGEVIRIM